MVTIRWDYWVCPYSEGNALIPKTGTSLLGHMRKCRPLRRAWRTVAEPMEYQPGLGRGVTWMQPGTQRR